jgi:hypothetical protein
MAEHRLMEDQVLRQRVEIGMQQWERLAEMQIAQFHQRLDAVLFQQHQRVTEMAWRSAGMPLTPQEHQDGVTDLLHDLRDDRIEYQEGRVLAMLERKLDGLYRAMDAQLPPGVDLPESYEGHVEATLYWQVADLQRQVDGLRSVEQTLSRSRDQGMGL